LKIILKLLFISVYSWSK